MRFSSFNMLAELPLVVLVVGVVAAGLWVSNIAYDYKVPHYISRKIGHGAGGLAFLASFVLSSPWWPIIIASIFGTLLLITHLIKPEVFRGVGGTGRNNKILAEVWFAWVAVPVFAICWLWLNKPGVAVSSLLFMAWGDGITGLVRWRVYNRAVKGLWGSVAMFCTCLVISWVFVSPLWIGIIGSAVATITERIFGEYGVLKWADDNWAIPIMSMAAILGLMAAIGKI